MKKNEIAAHTAIPNQRADDIRPYMRNLRIERKFDSLALYLGDCTQKPDGQPSGFCSE